MIKINICLSEQEIIPGYQNITPNQIKNLVNGSIDEIIFKGLDLMGYEHRSQAIIEILNKIKNNGHVIFEFLDIISVGKEVYLGSMNSKTVSGLIDGKKSLGYEYDILEIIQNFPQFKIKNRYNNNHNIVISVIKEIPNEQ